MPTTHRLGREAIHTYWDNSLPPQLTIAPGDTVVFDTLEASYGGTARGVASDPPPDLDPDLYQASREALRGMLDYLQERHDLIRAHACILASACVDLRISQIVDAPNWTVSAFLPLSIFEG